MTALIFGASGQDGHYLARLLAKRQIEPLGVARSGDGWWMVGDVANRERVDQLVRAYRPDFIFQLAANSTTRHEALFENHATISTGALNVLEAASTYAPQARVFLPGSGVQFRNEEGGPISAEAPFAAASAYAVARIQSVYAARYYREQRGLRVYVGYLFHHESPLRKPEHVSQKIALAARRIAAGSVEVLELGDIGVRKEWMFAGDAAEAMLALVGQEAVFEAAIGSGVGFTIEDWLERCFGLLGRNWRDHVRMREGFTPEYRSLISDPSTMHALGWRPTVDLEELAAMMVVNAAAEIPGRVGVSPAVPGILPGTSGNPHRRAALARTADLATNGASYSKRRRLPHFDKPWAIFFVTVPTRSRRILSAAARSNILAALLHFNQRRYELFAACVMPDHVHVLLQPWFKEPQRDGDNEFWPMSELMHSLKSFTAKEINRLEKTGGALWQAEYYHRYARGDRDLQEKFTYILENPWRANIVEPREAYPWIWTPDLDATRRPDVPGKMPGTAGETPTLPGT